MRWSVIQKAHAVEVFHRMASPTRALRALRREWGREAAPDRRVLGRWVAEFQRAGSVPGATRRARSRRANPSMVAAVQRAIRRSPRLSMRRLSAKTGVSRSWVHCILRQQLRLYPYKLQLVQRLHRGLLSSPNRPAVCASSGPGSGRPCAASPLPPSNGQ